MSSRNHVRRGVGLYITVAFTALFVALLGLTSLTITRIEQKKVTFSNDARIARHNAASAIQLALRLIEDDPNWRTTPNGVESTLVALLPNGTGTLSWILEDTDGSLLDADTDLRIKGIGRVGDTVQVSSVRIEPAPTNLDALLCALYSVGDMTQSSDSVAVGGPLATDGTLTVNGDITGDAEGDPVVIGFDPVTLAPGTVSGTITDPGPNRGMPDPEVWNTYYDLAVTIPFSSIPLDPANPSEREIERELIGPDDNPYGAANTTHGIYYIQVPAGWTLQIDDSRIAATLLIELGNNAQFKFNGKALWDPPPGKNYPSLIGKSTGIASFRFKGSNSDLKETDLPKVNFNPSHLPYNGESDTDQNDRYEHLVTGLFHIVGSNTSIKCNSHFNLRGALITEGTAEPGSNLTMTVDPAIYANPPMGYVAVSTSMETVAGTWRWDAAPPE